MKKCLSKIYIGTFGARNNINVSDVTLLSKRGWIGESDVGDIVMLVT